MGPEGSGEVPRWGRDSEPFSETASSGERSFPGNQQRVCPSERRGRERACRSEPPPRPRARVGPERQDGPEDHRAAERGAQLPLTRSALGCPPHATKRAARGHTARPAGPRAAGRGYQPGDPGPLSAPRPTARDASSTHPVAAAMFAQSPRHVK